MKLKVKKIKAWALFDDKTGKILHYDVAFQDSLLIYARKYIAKNILATTYNGVKILPVTITIKGARGK
jgi:hypothetical protein